MASKSAAKPTPSRGRGRPRRHGARVAITLRVAEHERETFRAIAWGAGLTQEEVFLRWLERAA